MQHTRYAPEGSVTEGFRYPAPGYGPSYWFLICSSRDIPTIPTTENTDRYFKPDLIQHDSRVMGREIHVVLSEAMKSLPRDVKGDYITTYSLKGDNAKLFEHPVV